MENFNKKRVGVLRGGDGDHYEKSLREGGEVISYVHENLSDKWKVFDILVDRSGIWHINGVPVMPAELSKKIDVVWNASHHSMSNVLENLFVPCVGVTSFSGALSESRKMLETHMKEINIKMPRHILLPAYLEEIDGPRDKYSAIKAKMVFEKFPAPWIVKSFTPNTNMGIHLAKTYPELIDAIEDGLNHGKSLLVEEFILGKVASTHSILGFRGENIYTFPPGNFSDNEKKQLIENTKNIFNHLNTKYYLQTNFVINPKRGIYLTHINFSPDLKEGSHFHQSCESVGAKIYHTIDHILENAL